MLYKNFNCYRALKEEAKREAERQAQVWYKIINM